MKLQAFIIRILLVVGIIIGGLHTCNMYIKNTWEWRQKYEIKLKEF